MYFNCSRKYLNLKSLSIIVVFLTTVLMTSLANAATFTVTRTDDRNTACDSGVDCSLREAISAANAATTDDVITFDARIFSIAQTIMLGGTQLEISNNGSLAINGTGAGNLAINGNNLSRVVFVNTGTLLTVNDLKITGGNGIGSPDSGTGGGIYISKSSNVTLNNSFIENNSASVFGCGGIFSIGTLNINQSSIVSNIALGGSANNGINGGGICNFKGTATIKSSFVGYNHATVSNNSQFGSYGGGIYNYQGTFTIDNSSIASNIADGTDSNSASGLGGGIYNANNGIIFLTNSAVYSNQADSNGAGINNNQLASLTISNSTISDNSAVGKQGIGGGIINFSTITLISVTLTNNTATQAGGGVFQSQNGNYLINSRNTIIAGNKNNTDHGVFPDDFNGKLTSQGFNLIGNTTGTIIAGITTGNLLDTNPLLDPILRNNGGPTLTHALFAGSPAINAGNNDSAPSTDQRGLARIVGGTIDIGAFEFAPTTKSRKRVRFF